MCSPSDWGCICRELPRHVCCCPKGTLRRSLAKWLQVNKILMRFCDLQEYLHSVLLLRRDGAKRVNPDVELVSCRGAGWMQHCQCINFVHASLCLISNAVIALSKSCLLTIRAANIRQLGCTQRILNLISVVDCIAQI